MKLESKLPTFGTSIFSTMSQLATKYEALNMSQGFPDFPVNAELIDRAHYYMEAGKNQYAPSPGLPELRKVIAKMNNELYHVHSDPVEEVTIFSGATEALFATFSSLVSEGDEIILFDPAYDSYDPAIRLAGGVPVHINLTYPSFDIPWELVETRISSKTKAIVINNPHNPTGAILEKSDLQRLSELAGRNDLLVISDEVYHNMIFDGSAHQSVLSFPDLKERSIAIFSFGKTLHATGWKVGYAVASPEITKEVRKVHQITTFSVNTPLQYALSDFMSMPESYNYLASFFQEKRDAFLSYLGDSLFEPIPSKGTYFQLLSYAKLTTEPDVKMAHQMTEVNGIASIPISVFYDDQTDNKVLRFCFAKESDTLKEATELLKAISKNQFAENVT